MNLKILHHLIHLNARQFYRLILEIGFARLIILTFIAITVILQILPLIKFNSVWAAFLPVISVLPINAQLFQYKHSQSNESTFLRIIDQKPFLIFLGKNIIFSSPFLLILLIYQNFAAIAIAILLLTALSGANLAKIKLIELPNFTFTDFRLLPWQIGMRNRIPLIIIIYMLAIATFFHISLFFIALFLLHFVILVFFYWNESQSILQSYGKKPGKFLNYYAKMHLYYYGLAIIPFLFISSMFGFSIILITLLIVVLLMFHQYLVLCLKFTFYEPGISNEKMQSIQILMMVFLLIPFTIPVPFIYAFVYRKKAIANLKVYL